MNQVRETPERGHSFWAIGAVVAAFGTYFCMYGFRKPFTAAAYESSEFWGIGFKTIAVSAQVIGYTLSKFIGIKVIAEMKPQRRAMAILGLIGIAHFALACFAFSPRPWNATFLFINGLMLGMVFGLVLGFLEGRRLTEALVAGLCASFILADGVTKSVGTWLLTSGVSEEWMPFVAGLIFLLPLCLFVLMLTRIPPPSINDVVNRTARETMSGQERWQLFKRYWLPLSMLVAVYLLLTVLRSIRADFAPELWRLLGAPAAAATYTNSEVIVALGVLIVNGAAVVFKNNRIAFFTSLATCGLGFAIIAGALLTQRSGGLGAFAFMVLIGVGLYLPYVAMHTTVFERLLAMTRERGNLGYLMYLADAFGYLGYVIVMIGRNFYPDPDMFLHFFIALCWINSSLSLCALIVVAVYFVRSPSKSRPGPAIPSSPDGNPATSQTASARP
ncbi:MAG: hypothetical protein CMJ47_06015 [Planctomyces sp.]|uniref:Major facilitator superfamily MFS_1 n=1 Tax=Rubinisphaera brasiliensis (strain ATCC 49424 / DSM 5305 / JCM 21570 / IAM 15109 / NBRC 103401 / IFAM 1448) TaxID=756272 RepID=F0STI5_RUBBR|nr:DUF5690 family protein [Rubinisphaera brasiliensis]ADY61454.1 hypothetical protein Plabr_3875 [Rubinisphaera brasiliensis DSM 5305]MBB02181.1 hypothetical protein [Planctomyces sp.]